MFNLMSNFSGAPHDWGLFFGCLIRCGAGNAGGDDAVADGVELLVGGFL